MTHYVDTHPGYRELELHFGDHKSLRLAMPTMEHAAASMAWVAQPDVMKMMGSDAQNVSLVGEQARMREILTDCDAYHWMIVLDERAVGNINLHDIARMSRLFAVKAASLAYLLGDPNLWGKGLGSAVVETVLSWAFTSGDFEVIAARAIAQNQRSRRLLERLGFREYGVEPYDGPGFGGPTVWHNYRLLKEYWLEHSRH
jgi:RimJ/RimL family protein N-acetyltransferase